MGCKKCRLGSGKVEIHGLKNTPSLNGTTGNIVDRVSQRDVDEGTTGLDIPSTQALVGRFKVKTKTPGGRLLPGWKEATSTYWLTKGSSFYYKDAELNGSSKKPSPPGLIRDGYPASSTWTRPEEYEYWIKPENLKLVRRRRLASRDPHLVQLHKVLEQTFNK